MQNTYQEKLADLEVNNSKKIKKLEGGINFKIKEFYKMFKFFKGYFKYNEC